MGIELPSNRDVRSGRLLSAGSSFLIVVDVQEKLFPLIVHSRRIEWNVSRLVRGAHEFEIRTILTEQYPEKLGRTILAIGKLVEKSVSKRMFSCRECASEFHSARMAGKTQIVLCGIETHVCVMQTALDLLADGWEVFVVADAVGARGRLDHRVALDRMRSGGATVTTTESILFEWCETSINPKFSAISQLVRESRDER